MKETMNEEILDGQQLKSKQRTEITYNQYIAQERAKQEKWEPSVKVRPPKKGEFVQRYVNFSMCFAEPNPREGRPVE